MSRNETAPAVMIPRCQPTGIINKQEPHKLIIYTETGSTIILPAIPPPLPPISINATAETVSMQSLHPNYSTFHNVIQEEAAPSACGVSDDDCYGEYYSDPAAVADSQQQYAGYGQSLHDSYEPDGVASFYVRHDDNAAIQPIYKTPSTLNLNQFHIIKDGKAVGVSEMSIVTHLIQSKHFFVINGTPYIYEGGVYVEDKEGILLKAEIQKLIYRNLITNYRLTSVYKLLIIQPEIQRRFANVNQQPKHMINFLNGMFDVKTFTMWSHDPKYYSINQIPHKLDLSLDLNDISKYPNTVQFFRFALPARDDREMLFEYLGYSMTIDTMFQRFMVMKGPSNSGKGRVLKLFLAIIGEPNKTTISLKQLTERFYPTKLYGKLFGACGDIASHDLHDISVIKQVTGEDEITHELKGVDSKDFLSYAKLLFSANRIPKNKDEQSAAFYNRLMILLMEQVAPKLDGELINRIIPEIPYIILLAVNSLRNAYERGELLESQNSKRLVHQLRRDSDNVTAFCEDCLKPNPSGGVKTTDVHDAYKAYCASVNEQPIGRTKFYDALTEKGFQRMPSQGVDYFVDLRLMPLA